MKKIPASQKMRKELERLLKGVDTKGFVLSEIIRKRSFYYSSGIVRTGSNRFFR